MTKPSISTEEQLTVLLVEYLRRNGFDVASEVPSMGQSVDVVARRRDALYLFEAKLNDWRRALKQAKPHLLIAEFVLVVVPRKTYSREFYELAIKSGIGVIMVDIKLATSRMIVHPRRSRMVWPPQRRQFERNLESQPNGD